ncbi:uncharacterized protein LOC116289191 [Actinia tenebrosa]|uniref:Uncharacterized protein LOC116289191 n=1 Tax=Actinia tenebrosa TaxID=6105 RepID=A0A6P8H6A9_ACTTE|nr:uncharacterized protein LOC116289191 [Actinia tenebrosa]
MVLCVVPGCGSRSERDKGIGYYRIPSVITNKGEFEEELTTERRNEWIKAIDRSDTDTKQVLASERVCGKRFVNGQPAPYWNKYHEDWVPTLILRKKKYGTKINFEAQAKRDGRSRKREKLARERQERESAEKQKLYESSLPVVEIDFRQSSSSRTFEGSQDKGEEGLNEEELFADVIVTEGEGENRKDAGCQTTSGTTEYQAAECQTTEFEYMFQKSKYQAPSKYFFESDEKVRFYTGLPSQEVLMVVFNHVAPYVTQQTQSLDRFQEFMIVLIKLRLNPPLQDLAYRFAVAVSTISRIFFHWVVVMDARLFPFVYWPDRDQLWRTMPQCYQYAFGKKTTVVIDCFEVFIEKPSNLLAKAQTFSSYKHHNTIKVLIGITLQGTISYVSEAWGGRVSDKFLTENCGFLEKLIPGDMVMADRGFTITESVGLMQAKLVVPAFTKGKAQLDPVDVETTRGIANVRIHVERVIGLLRRKYTVFQSTLPTDFLICNHRYSDRHTPLVDSMLRVCAALVNFCPPIVPFD